MATNECGDMKEGSEVVFDLNVTVGRFLCAFVVVQFFLFLFFVGGGDVLSFFSISRFISDFRLWFIIFSLLSLFFFQSRILILSLSVCLLVYLLLLPTLSISFP